MTDRYWRLALLIGGLLSILAFTGACGGDDDDAPEATGSSNTAESGDDETPEATEEPEEDEGEDDADDALERLREAAANAPDTYYYSYEIENEGEFEEDDYSGTLTLARSGDRELFSMKLTEAAGDSELTIITGSDSVINCLIEAGDESDPVCIETEGSGGMFGDLTALFLTAEEMLDEFLDEEGAEATKAGTRRIAGLDTQCYDIRDDTGEGTVCIAEDENVMASMDGEFDGAQSTFTLIEYDEDPDDSVFDPPYEVSDLGG